MTIPTESNDLTSRVSDATRAAFLLAADAMNRFARLAHADPAVKPDLTAKINDWQQDLSTCDWPILGYDTSDPPDNTNTVNTTTFEFTVTDWDPGTTYTPWSDGHAVGFRCERNGEVEYVYLNPSGRSDDQVPTIFPYQGRTGEAGQDGGACDHHFVVFSSDPIDETI